MTQPALSPNAWLRWDGVRRHLRHLPTVRSVLEIGAGQGAAGCRLAEGRTYVGVEPDDLARAVAAERLPAGTRLFPSLDAVGPGERFDLVAAFEVLEHVVDDRAEVARWVEHLSPGGHLLLSVPAHDHRYGAADDLVGHVRRYGREDLRAVLVDAGLEPVAIDATGFPLGHLLERGRNRLARRAPRVAVGPDPLAEDPDVGLAARTAASGRTWQPPPWAGPVTQLATVPFRLAQRPFRRTELATGWLALARRPPS